MALTPWTLCVVPEEEKGSDTDRMSVSTWWVTALGR